MSFDDQAPQEMMHVLNSAEATLNGIIQQIDQEGLNYAGLAEIRTISQQLLEHGLSNLNHVSFQQCVETVLRIELPSDPKELAVTQELRAALLLSLVNISHQIEFLVLLSLTPGLSSTGTHTLRSSRGSRKTSC